MIQKALITGFGDESKITVVQEEIRAPSANEVQVEVDFSGFSGADINMRRGTYPMQKKPPFTPGYCFVGRVSANGSGSTKFRIGTRVACLSIYGAEAELINVPEKYLVSVPEGVDSQEATAWSCVPHASRLATRCLFMGLVAPLAMQYSRSRKCKELQFTGQLQVVSMLT